MDWDFVVGLVILGVGITLAVVLLLVGRAGSRRDQQKGPLDSETVEELRADQQAVQDAQTEKWRNRGEPGF